MLVEVDRAGGGCSADTDDGDDDDDDDDSDGVTVTLMVIFIPIDISMVRLLLGCETVPNDLEYFKKHCLCTIEHFVRKILKKFNVYCDQALFIFSSVPMHYVRTKKTLRCSPIWTGIPNLDVKLGQVQPT